MKRAMKRMVTAAAMVAAVWVFAAEHVGASTPKSTHHQTSCHQIRAALQSGKSMKAVEKELNVSSAHIRQCGQQKATTAANPQRSSSQAH